MEQENCVLKYQNLLVWLIHTMKESIIASKFFLFLMNHDRMSMFDNRCDRSRHFFRTNYEYDEKCARTFLLWWPQMLAICLLVFFIFILLGIIFYLYRRRERRVTKKY